MSISYLQSAFMTEQRQYKISINFSNPLDFRLGLIVARMKIFSGATVIINCVLGT